MKKLSKEAKDFLRIECESSIKYWVNEIKKTAKNQYIPPSVKMAVKALKQNKINMYKEILEFIK